MRIEVSTSMVTTVNNFVVHAETPSEVALLHQFTRYGDQRRRLFMHSFGGNIGENVYSFCFGWREESDFAKPSIWRALRKRFLA